MYFDDKFLKSLPKKPNEGIVTICKEFERRWKLGGANYFDLIIESFALISTYSEAYNLGITVPQITDDTTPFRNNVKSFISRLLRDFNPKAYSEQFEQYKSGFATRLGTGFYYEFSEGDLKRIQVLINELRNLISASEDLEAKHKRRVLNKLEKLQSEIHKSVSDLDTFYGSVIELSVVARIVGENLKPVVDRVRELVSIVWPAQARAFGLPSNAPFELPGQTEDDKS